MASSAPVPKSAPAVQAPPSIPQSSINKQNFFQPQQPQQSPLVQNGKNVVASIFGPNSSK